MATVIDALVVTLGLDPTKFKKGSDDARAAMKQTREEGDKTGRSLEESGKRGAEGLASIKREALALLSVFTAGVGIVSFVKNAIGDTARLSRTSSDLNMSAKSLAQWQIAAKRAGGTAEGITALIADAQSAVGNAKLGIFDGKTQELAKYGGDLSALQRGSTAYLMEQANVIARVRKAQGEDAARAVAGRIGVTGDNYHLFRNGGAALQEQLNASAKLAEAQANLADKAEAMRQRWVDFQNRIQEVSLTILDRLMPALNQVLAWFMKIADWIADHKGDISNWIDEAVVEMEKFVDMANKAADAVGGWKNVLLGLGALKVLSMASPILSLGAALLSVGTGLGSIAAGAAAVPALASLLGVAALALHSEGLNENEQRTTQAGDKWDGDPIGTKRRGGPANDPKAQAAVDYYVSKGYSRSQAAGLVANLWTESLLDPKAVGDGGKAYGIGQWHPDRQEDFKKLFGIDIRKSTYEQQLQFADYELSHGEKAAGDKLRATHYPGAAAEIVSRNYERPADADGEARKRAQYAVALYGGLRQPIADPSNFSIQALPSGASASAPAAAGGRGNSTSSSTSETNFNAPITIVTQATDAKGIWRDLPGVGRAASSAGQMNTGVSQ